MVKIVIHFGEQVSNARIRRLRETLADYLSTYADAVVVEE
jgi:hypothetical protein